MTSQHYAIDRQSREKLIAEIGQGKVYQKFIVDKGHPNGAEIHTITTTGIIIIHNQRTKKLITKLIARPGQIKRYYKKNKAPVFLIKIAIENQKRGYNYD